MGWRFGVGKFFLIQVRELPADRFRPYRQAQRPVRRKGVVSTVDGPRILDLGVLADRFLEQTCFMSDPDRRERAARLRVGDDATFSGLPPTSAAKGALGATSDSGSIT